MASAFTGGGLNGNVAGWGATATGGNPTTSLQWFTTTTITNADCQSRFTARGEHRAASFVFAHKVCTFSRTGQGFCQGDSGGGLVISNVVHGIVSWNIPCGQGVPDGKNNKFFVFCLLICSLFNQFTTEFLHIVHGSTQSLGSK